MSEHALDPQEQLAAMYENDPIGTIAAISQHVAQETVQQEAGQAAYAGYTAGAGRVAAMENTAAEQATLLAAGTLEAKYGTAWTDNRGLVAMMINEDPGLLPEGELHSPHMVAARLDNALKLAAHDPRFVKDRYAREDERQAWTRIQKAGANTYNDLMNRPGQE